jgi:hypothetical protein
MYSWPPCILADAGAQKQQSRGHTCMFAPNLNPVICCLVADGFHCVSWNFITCVECLLADFFGLAGSSLMWVYGASHKR